PCSHRRMAGRPWHSPSNPWWPAGTTAREPHSDAAGWSGLRDRRAHGRRSRKRVPRHFAGQSTLWRVRHSSAGLAPSPGTTASFSCAASALRGCDPAPKSPWAVGRTQAYGAAGPPPSAPAMPEVHRLALRRSWLETRSVPSPTLPLPPQHAPASALRRCPSVLGCQSDCVRSAWLLRWLRGRFFLSPSQAACTNRRVQSVGKYLRGLRWCRFALPRIQQLLRLLERLPFQDRGPPMGGLRVVEPFRPVISVHR